jgi:hypothetical protein
MPLLFVNVPLSMKSALPWICAAVQLASTS